MTDKKVPKKYDSQHRLPLPDQSGEQFVTISMCHTQTDGKVVQSSRKAN